MMEVDPTGRTVWNILVLIVVLSIMPLIMAIGMGSNDPAPRGPARFIFTAAAALFGFGIIGAVNRLQPPAPKRWVKYYVWVMAALALYVATFGAFLTFIILNKTPDRIPGAYWIQFWSVVAMAGSSLALLLIDLRRQRRNAKGPADGEASSSQ